MTSANPHHVVTAARGWLGTPYHDQASLKGVGCDCLGLARGVWRDVVGPEPTSVPPYTRDWGEVSDREVLADNALRWMTPVPRDEATTGDLVLFRMRTGAVAKHCETFIHSYDRLGVIEEHLTDPWRRRIAFAFRYPEKAD